MTDNKHITPQEARELVQKTTVALAVGGKCKKCGQTPVDDPETVDVLAKCRGALRSLADQVEHLRECRGATGGLVTPAKLCRHPAHGDQP